MAEKNISLEKIRYWMSFRAWYGIQLPFPGFPLAITLVKAEAGMT